jgi:Siphovirus Gp157
MAALVAVPSPGITVDSLFQVETYLAAMIETAELVPQEQEQEFLAEFRQALSTAVEQRDRVAQYMAHLETQADFAKAEIDRLRQRKGVYERAFERLEQYVLNTIEYLGVDAKGARRKLEGNTITFSARACPASVEIVDEAAVPAEFKTLTIRLPATTWERLLDSLDLEERADLLGQVKRAECEVSKSGIKTAIDSGACVPGAALSTNKLSLRRS